jgi:hypothetical protein
VKFILHPFGLLLHTSIALVWAIGDYAPLVCLSVFTSGEKASWLGAADRHDGHQLFGFGTAVAGRRMSDLRHQDVELLLDVCCLHRSRLLW